jgi:membrane associated rhomboid family serine protease
MRTMFGNSPRNPLRALPGGCPATWALLAANAFTFVTSFVRLVHWDWLAFHAADAMARPWSVLTYPLLGGEAILWLLIGAYVFWIFGGSLERAWGARDYIVFLAAVSVAAAVGLWIGSTITGRSTALHGTWMLLAAAVVAWSYINPRERVLAFFVLPIEGRWFAVIALVLVVFSFPFPLGVFALLGLAVARWYVVRGRYSLIRPARSRVSNPVGALRRWWLKRRFRRLMRDSGLREDDRIH